MKSASAPSVGCTSKMPPAGSVSIVEPATAIAITVKPVCALLRITCLLTGESGPVLFSGSTT
jgi:hypothetical protein